MTFIRANLRHRIPIAVQCPCDERYLEQFVVLAEQYGKACTGKHVSKSIQDYWRAQGGDLCWPVFETDHIIARIIAAVTC